MNTLKAEKRNMTDKAKKLRRDGFVIGNIFGKEMEETMPIQMAKADAEHLLKTNGKGGQVTLEIDGQNIDVLIKKVDFNPLKKQIDHLEFQALVAGEKIHSTAPIELLNHEKVTVGLVNQLLHEISYKAVPSALIDKIKIDVGDMHLGDAVRVMDLDIAKKKDIEILTDLDALIVNISERHSSAEEEADEETTE